MRISLNWLKDYVAIKHDFSIEKLSETLTCAGLEVEAIEDLSKKSAAIFLGRVHKVSPLDSNMFCYELQHGEENVRLKATSHLCELDSIVAFKRVEGHEFNGELADFQDLGLGLGAHIIIQFPQDFFSETVPLSLSELPEFCDTVFTLGITPNRADALNHIGVSRELSALLDIDTRSPLLVPREMAGPTHEKAVLDIDDAHDCPRYACRVVTDVKVTKSPFWLQLRLLLAGIRPINNVVDITNFVMLSRGQPLHAFDYDKLEKENGRAKITIRRAQSKEQFVALDGQKHSLSEQDLVVADNKSVIALAGVIGGLDSAVSESTKTILLESAYFDPKKVRMTSRRLNISTESSYRFERGTDPNGVMDALNYAARLLTEMSDCKVCREPIDVYRTRIEPQEIKMRPERAQEILGIEPRNFDQDIIRKRFSRLGFETVAKRGDAIYFRVPTYRSDVTREIDLIEEAARMIGYDHVAETDASFDVGGTELFDSRAERVAKKLKTFLSARGFFEAVNYAFVQKEIQQVFFENDPEQSGIALKNPLSDRFSVMRKSLLPGLVKNLSHNLRNQEKTIQLFEIGTVFSEIRAEGATPDPARLSHTLDQDSYCVERQMIAGVLYGAESYQAFDIKTKTYDFFHLKGIVSEAIRSLGLTVDHPGQEIHFGAGASCSFLHPGESTQITYQPVANSSKKIIGSLGRLHPQITKIMGSGDDAFVFELDIQTLAEIMRTLPLYRPFSRFPAIERDVSFLIDESVLVDDVLKVSENVTTAAETLAGVQLFDIYRGKNIEQGKKAIAVKLTLQRTDRTLTDDEADYFVNQFTDLVVEKNGAQLR